MSDPRIPNGWRASIPNQADAKDRIIERHVRWRAHALALLTHVVTTEPEKYPEIADFLYRSNQRMEEA